MDFLSTLRNDPGALIIGALWGITVLATSISKSRSDSKNQREADAGTSSLNATLQAAYKAQGLALTEERDRGDRLSNQLNELSGEIGALRASIKYVTEDRDEHRAEVLRLTITIESLVLENRNKDKSITQLVDLNRQILRSIGSTTDALEPVQLEIENGRNSA